MVFHDTRLFQLAGYHFKFLNTFASIGVFHLNKDNFQKTNVIANVSVHVLKTIHNQPSIPFLFCSVQHVAKEFGFNCPICYSEDQI